MRYLVLLNIFFLFCFCSTLFPSLHCTLSFSSNSITMFRHVCGSVNVIFFPSPIVVYLYYIIFHVLVFLFTFSLCLVRFSVDTFHSVTTEPHLSLCTASQCLYVFGEFCFRLLAFCPTLIQAMKIMLQPNMTHTTKTSFKKHLINRKLCRNLSCISTMR